MGGSQELSNRLFTTAPDLMCVSTFQGRFAAVNPAWEKTFGIPVHTFLETPWITFVHPEDRVRSMAESVRLRTERTCFNFVNRLICSNGRYRWLSWNAEADPESQQIYGVGRDITDTGWGEKYIAALDVNLESQIDARTKQWQQAVNQLQRQLAARAIANETLRDAHELLSSIVRASPHAIIAVDADRNVRLWNPAATHIFGWTEDETLGRRVPFVNEDQRKQSDEFNRRALAGEAFTNFMVERTRRDGNPVDLLVSAAPTLNASGQIDGFLAIATDMTEYKKLEQQFLRTQRLEGLGKLASGIAHDLNNVLTPISMSLELLRMKSSDTGLHRTLDTLSSCVSRGSDLVRQILTFARGVEGERIPIQTSHLLNDMWHALKEIFPKSIKIDTDIPRDLWKVHADATQIQQVLINLSVNARDAMPGGGMLTIHAENVNLDEAYIQMSGQGVPGPFVMIEIKDDGAGIPVEVRERIFEPFFTTKEVGKGTGLGLSSVAAIVKNHGGFVSLYSEVGRGTSFKVYLPGVANEGSQAAVGGQPVPLGNGELILIVDDESAVRDIAKAILETHGYKVITAEDGAEGVAAYARHRDAIRLVISDTDMPIMSGAAMLRSIRKENPQVRVITSGGLSPDDSAGDDHDRAVFRLPKPYTAAQLLHTVRNTLLDA
jgi:two-component system cell cycle sensor histidine kinase/response regulator CckA